MTALTAKKLHLLTHSIGWGEIKPRDRARLRSPEDPWRNHFCADIGHDSYGDLLELVRMGLMEQRGRGSFSVTSKGIACVKEFLGGAS